ncbi:hypothetical protein, partial [Escherichia coli]|uniref:hypothetical protein n=1 Tax=Escherichia coli TaxID=562 RepID=UPI0039ECCA49
IRIGKNWQTQFFTCSAGSVTLTSYGNPPQFINRQGHPDETNYHERYAATERSGCAIASAPRAP